MKGVLTMHKITQEEFNELCNGDAMSRLEDCIIGEEIEYPKKIHRVTFKNCVFGKSFNNDDVVFPKKLKILSLITVNLINQLKMLSLTQLHFAMLLFQNLVIVFS